MKKSLNFRLNIGRLLIIAYMFAISLTIGCSKEGIPSVTTCDPDVVKYTYFIAKGYVEESDNCSYTVGIYLNNTPEINSEGRSFETFNQCGEFTKKIGLDNHGYLNQNTTYYYCAYLKMQQETYYGDFIEVKTLLEIPVENPCEECEIVSDVDGNNYKTVKIGNQCWMAENLRTTKYNDGTNITHIQDSIQWFSNTNFAAAYCWFNNDYEQYGSIYGAIYNYWALESGKLCPIGWHASTDSDWFELELYLGVPENELNLDKAYRGVNQGAMLAGLVDTWYYDSNIIDNPYFGSTGFDASASGERYSSQAFSGNRLLASWWCLLDQGTAIRMIHSVAQGIYRGTNLSQRYGHSVRCVKD